MNDYELEKQLVEDALAGRWFAVDNTLRYELELAELNALTDMLDKLAALVDEEAIRRAEKRR